MCLADFSVTNQAPYAIWSFCLQAAHSDWKITGTIRIETNTSLTITDSLIGRKCELNDDKESSVGSQLTLFIDEPTGNGLPSFVSRERSLPAIDKICHPGLLRNSN